MTLPSGAKPAEGSFGARARSPKKSALGRAGLLLGLLLVGASLGASTVAVEGRDEAGHLQMRTELGKDGSRHSTFYQYWPGGAVERRLTDLDFDGAGRPTRRLVQEFDERGGLVVATATTFDAAGRQSVLMTRYLKDEKGRIHPVTSAFER